MLEAMGSLLRGAEDLIHTIVTRAPTWMIQFPQLVKPEQREALQREILGSETKRYPQTCLRSARAFYDLLSEVRAFSCGDTHSRVVLKTVTMLCLR
jgi:hypothetical protein